jgi:hypothetical protein
VEIEETHQFMIEEQPVQDPTFSSEEQPDHIPSFSSEEQSTLEDQRQTDTPVISKPRRSRHFTKSQKNTEEVQASTGAIDNITETTKAPDMLEK